MAPATPATKPHVKKLTDQLRLAETVNKLNQGKLFNFAYGSQVDHFDLQMCQVEDLGYIQVPVSLVVSFTLEDVKSLSQTNHIQLNCRTLQG